MSLGESSIQVYSIDDGLPSRLITSLYQDHRGLTWIGTYGGLVRYDGLHFSKLNRHVIPDMRSHNISAMTGDPRENLLWVSTAGGDLYRVWGNRVERHPVSSDLPHPEISKLALTATGDLWIGSFGGLCRLRGGDLKCFDDRDGLPLDLEAGERTLPTVFSLGFDATGRLWVGTLAGLARQVGHRFEAVELLEGEVVEALQSLRDGRLLAGTNLGRVGVLDERGLTPILELGRAVRVSELEESKNGDVWIGTFTNGAGRWDGRSIQWINRSSSLPVNNVQSLLVDREGVTWIGTTRDLAQVAETPIIQLGKTRGLSDPAVLGMDEAADGLLVVTSDGALSRFDGVRFHSVQPWSGGHEARGLRFAHEDSAGDLWLSVRPTGLYRWTRGRPPRAETFFDGIRVSAFLETSEGDYWVATWNHGLFRKTADGWHRFGKAEGLPSPGIFTLFEARDQSIWIGTRLGPARYANGVMTDFGPQLGLSDPAIMSFHEDAEGLIWMGTITKGLVQFDGEVFNRVGEEQGLRDNSVWAVVEDRAGSFWISSTPGISKVLRSDLLDVIGGAKSNLTVTHFGPSDGLVTPNGVGGFQSAGLLLTDGSIAIATTGGVALVRDPLRVAEVKPPPPALVLGAVVDDVRRPIEGWLDVPAGSRRTTIEVSAPTMVGVEHVSMRARLAGSDVWDDLGRSREISYTNLKPGRVVFEIESSRDGTNWSEASRLPILVEPKWNQTWWFRLGVVVAVLFVGYLMRWFEMRRSVQRERQLSRLVAEQTEELRLANLRLEQQTITDSLTGLANRRRLDGALGEEWLRASRAGDPLAMLFVDVDDFKPFNDHLGHSAGDECLREVAGVIAGHARRAGDLAARYGGEEFCVLLPNTGVDEARALAEELRGAVIGLRIEHPKSSVGEVVTVSIGVASTVPVGTEDPDQLLQSADRALYEAKGGGKNRVVVEEETGYG